MWPFERRCDVLRVGRDRVELWAWEQRGLVMQAQQTVSGTPFDGVALRSAVTRLLQGGERARALDVVIESAWLPVLPIEPGPALLSRIAAEALLRHRVTTVFGVPEAGGAWELMVEHRAGDRQGLGFALASTVHAALLDALTAAKCRARSMQPACAWGRTRFGSRVPRDGWWLWLERDRTLIAVLRKGRVVALNAAAPVVSSTTQAMRLVEIESVRQGLEADTITAACWHDLPTEAVRGATPRFSWLTVSASAADGLSPATGLGSTA